MELSRSTAPLQWRKSSYSVGGECVEVASDERTVFVRDFKDRQRSALIFSESAWCRFVLAVKEGRSVRP